MLWNVLRRFNQARREWREYEREGKLPRSPRRLGAPPSLRNTKYTRTRHFKKQNSKKFSPKGIHENVSPGPAVALDVSEWKWNQLTVTCVIADS